MTAAKKEIFFKRKIISGPVATKQGCQIFLGTTHQNGKNLPNGYKIYQMATKYTKWLQNIPKREKYTKWDTKYAKRA
jgi:hypothetical protein